MKIVFATNNEHKLFEIRNILGKDFEILSLSDIGCNADIPETASTLEENAMQKARYVFDNYHISCFADDTGLEVEALGGEPGVRSARYDDQTDHNSEANMQKLLKNMENIAHRKARFRTVIALILLDKAAEKGFITEYFEGIIEGEITQEKHGEEGFGYDPLFKPAGYDQTFAELGMEIKNAISHRARAVNQLAQYLDLRR